MIIHTTNLLLAPLLIAITAAIWLINAYLLMLALRLFTRKLDAAWAGRLSHGLEPIVDPAPAWIKRRLTVWRGRAPHDVTPWLCVVVGAVVIQQLLVAIVVAMA